GNAVTFGAIGTAGAATQIAHNAGNDQAATVGTAVATPPSVIVRDQFANPVPGVAVSFATSGDNGTVDPATPVATGANGIAAANSWTLGTAAKVDTLRATAAGLSGSPVTFTATATAGGPSTTQSTVAAAPATITAGAGSSTITVTVRDANGNPIQGATVTLAVSPATGSTLTQPAGTTNTSGQITGALSSTAAGTKTVTATVNGTVTVTQTADVAVNPAAAATIAPHGGSGQTAPAGTTVPNPPSVIVTDAFDNPVSGVSVTFAAGLGSGSVTGSAQTTDANGIATEGSSTLPTTAGSNPF